MDTRTAHYLEKQNLAATTGDRVVVSTTPDHEQRKLLSDLWNELDTQKFEVWCYYPNTDGSGYHDEWSGTVCRQIPGYSLWVCTDESEGTYLASQHDVDGWTLVASSKD